MRRTFITLALLGIMFAGCGRGGEKKEADVIARVDGSALTVSDLMSRVPPEFRGALTREQWIKLINDWCEQQILANYAISRGALDDPQVRRKIEQAKIQILQDYIRNRIIAPAIKISDEEIERYYLEHQGDFVREHDEVRALHIVVSSKSLADTVKKFLKADSSFCAVAKRFSEEYSKTDSCDLGWFSRADLLPDLIRPVFRANPGEWVGPIKGGGKYHFFFIVDKGKDGTVRSLEQVRDQIYSRLFAEKFAAYMSNLLDSLRAATQIQIDTTVLDSVIMSAQRGSK